MINSHVKAATSRTEILAVEDSPTQAEELKHILEQQGYGVTIVRDGQAALTYLSEYRPDLVISDINMPTLNGYQLCQRLKLHADTWLIPVMLLTVLSTIEDVFEGLACGADSFITKPYSKAYLLGQVHQMLTDPSLRPGGRPEVEITFALAGQARVITADPQRMVSLLASICAAATHRNTELVETQDTLRLLNANLEELVEARTAVLSTEIIGRERLQAELQALSLRDELTGLYNRRGFMTLAEQHWRLALRLQQSFAVLYVDVDNFKQINDTFGHAQGDLALPAIARVLEDTFRDSDILARFGGDEFVALLTNCSAVAARAALVRLQTRLDRSNANGTERYQIALSVGLALFEPDRPVGLAALLDEADAQMYLQKRSSQEGITP